MGKIDHAVAKQMVNNYAETRKKLIDQTHGINDTQSIWFSVDEVKQFVADLSAGATGVRIYLGAYDNDYPSTPNQTCIIAIETLKDASSGKHVDSMQQAVAPLDGGGGGGPANNGKVCPPVC
jgi:hypothetical protein